MSSANIAIELHPGPGAPASARRLVAALLEPCHPESMPDAELAVSEVASNAVIHGAGSLFLKVEVGDRAVTLTVTDCGEGFTLPVAEPEGPGGYGLGIVDNLAEAWGVETGPPTIVWCRIPHD